MTGDEAADPERSGRLLRAVLTWACIVLSAALVWTWFAAGGRTRVVKTPPLPGAERAAEAVSPAKGGSPSESAGPKGESPEAIGHTSPTGALSDTSSGGDDGRRGPDAGPGRSAAVGSLLDTQNGPPAGKKDVGLTVSTPGGSAPAEPGAGGTRIGAGAEASSRPRTPDQVVTRPANAPAAKGATPPPEAEEPKETEEPTENASGSDRKPPVLEMLRFEPPVVEGGGVTNLTVEASDDLSGLKSVRGEIQSPGGTASLAISPHAASGGGTITIPLTIPRDAETGIWFVRWMSLTDGADNSSLVQAFSASEAPRGGTFTVYSSRSDSIAPEVLHVSFDRAALEDQGRNVIQVEARDDSSGIASITGSCRSPSRSALVSFMCALNPESGLWEGEIVMPADAECGEWTVQQIRVEDKAGNTGTLAGDSPLLAHAVFQTARQEGCDSTPPTLVAFELSPKVVSNQATTEIQVTATVTDVGSGAVALTGWFEGPMSEGGQVPKNHFHCAPDTDNPSAPWTGTIEVPQYAPKGTWKVGTIRLEDKARNFREYTASDPVVSGRAFEVQ